MPAWFFPTVWGAVAAVALIRILLLHPVAAVDREHSVNVKRRQQRSFLWAGFLLALVGLFISLFWTQVQMGWLGVVGVIFAWVVLGLIAALWPRVAVSVVASIVLAALTLGPATPAIANAISATLPDIPQNVSEMTGDGPIDEPDATQLNLIANPPEVDCVALATKYDLPMEGDQAILTYIPNQVDESGKGADGKPARLYSSSVNLKLQPTEYQRFYASVFTQPEMAGMVGVALANDAKLADANPGILKRFVNTTPKQWADQVFSGKVSYEEATTVSCQLVAILGVFQEGSKPETAKTAWNYHAQDAISTKGDVRGIVRNDTQYEGEFLTLSITRKGQDGCWLKLGINTKDQRIAGLECEKPKPKPTTPPTIPPVDECVKPASPGNGSTWNQALCKWEPPEKKYCTAPDGKQYPEGDARCTPPEKKFCTAPDGKKYPEGDERCNPPKPEMCPWNPALPVGDPNCLEPKKEENDPEPPPGVTEEPLDPQDPVEKEPPVVEDPSNGTEEPGDSSPDVTVDDPDTSVQDPVGPPAGEDETPSTPEDPEEVEITDPDAAPNQAALWFGFTPLVLVALRRRITAAVAAFRGE